MKRAELAFAALLVPLDYVLVLAAAATAYGLRYQTLSGFRPFVGVIPAAEYRLSALVAAGVFVLCFAIAGLYRTSHPRRLLIEVPRILLAASAAAMAVSALIFFRGELFASRFIVLAAWVLAAVFVSVGRIVVRLLQRWLLLQGVGKHRVVVIGGEDVTTELLIKSFAERPSAGVSVVARFAKLDNQARATIDALRAEAGVDELFVTRTDVGRDELAELLGFAQSRHLGFKYAADLVATYGRNVEVGTLADVPFVEIKGTRLDGWGRIFKRLFDIFGSLILIVITSPIMLLAAMAVKLTSRGPIFFLNERVGLSGKLFNVYKFRSMRAEVSVGAQFGNQEEALRLEAELIKERSIKQGPLYKIKDDPRITKVGHFIRRYSIDELPQLFNVLTGSMSLVGPRPHQPREVEKYEDHHRRLLSVRPGITGMAQISGRSNLSFEDEVRLDTYYIENWSPWLDLIILLKTPFAVLRSKGAY